MKIYLIAGEPSGDKLGAALMVGLRSLCPDVTFQGIGGPLMQAEGLHSLFDMADLSVMGLAEVVPRYAMLRRRLATAVADVIQAAPDALITIDSPDFCLRVSVGVAGCSASLRPPSSAATSRSQPGQSAHHGWSMSRPIHVIMPSP